MRWGSVARVCQDVILNVALSGEERLSQGPGLCTAFKVALSRPLLFGGFAHPCFEFPRDINVMGDIIGMFFRL